MSGQIASFFVIHGRDQGRRFELNRHSSVIGRDTLADIQLRDLEVSRRHAEIRVQDGHYELVDLGSSNGTFVNAQKVDCVVLGPGDRVQLGRSLLLFTSSEPGEPLDLRDDIDILPSLRHEESRIVRSIPHESSGITADVNAEDSPWLARAKSNLQVMYRTALAVSHTLDIDELLERIMELIFEWVEADRGCIMLVDRETGELTPAVRKDRHSKPQEARIQISRTILDYVRDKREGVITSDACDDERFRSEASVVKNGVREAICVPMQGRYGGVGVIYIDTFTPPGRVVERGLNCFRDEHLKLMVAIGHQAALAIEDTHYYSAMVQSERLAAVGQTIATLSHHVKNILQGIRGGGYLVSEGLNSNDLDVVRRGWRILERNQDRISALVMDMLSLSKEREPASVMADLNDTIFDCIELMTSRAKELGVELTWAPDKRMPNFWFDPEGIHRAVLNVITNAIDACEKCEKASVRVSTEFDPVERRAVVFIDDNGEGIEPEDLERIFSVFESKKGARGTGLGLPVSRKILREHGGDVHVESTPGRGSRFKLELPAKTLATALTEPPSHEAPSSKSHPV